MITFNAIHAEITWTLSENGTLTISGTDMPDYIGNAAPWSSNKYSIMKVVINDGVTSIGGGLSLIALALPLSPSLIL